MVYEQLISEIEKLKATGLKNKVEERILEFKNTGKSCCDRIYEELCYCILTANFNAERAIKIHERICECFLNMREGELERVLRDNGYRFPFRAKYIVNARKYREKIKELVDNNIGESEFREWLKNNIKGLGYKEASHFMRNIGYSNIAIIDSHILELLEKHRLVNKPKTLTKRKYLEIEGTLREIAEQNNLSLAELDLYLWYIETGKILK